MVRFSPEVRLRLLPPFAAVTLSLLTLLTLSVARADTSVKPDQGKFPVILQRSPYSRAMAVEATSYAKRGYVCVAQDVRGRFDSEDEFHFLSSRSG